MKKTQKTHQYRQEISKNHENKLTGKQVVLLIPLTKFFAQKENIKKLKDIIEGQSKLSLRLIDWFVTNYSKKKYVMYNLKKYSKVSKYETLKKSTRTQTSGETIFFPVENSTKTNNTNNAKESTKTNKKNKNKNSKNNSKDENENEVENENEIENKNNCRDENEDENEDIELFNDYFNVFNDYRAQLKSLNKRNFDPFCRRSRIKFHYGKNKDDFIITTVGQLNFFKWAIENYILEYIEEHLKIIDEDMNNNIDLKKYNDKTKKKKKEKPKTTRAKRKELSISASKSFMIHKVKTIIEFS